jgi:aspartate/methionine/tyrosine aminotransferase
MKGTLRFRTELASHMARKFGGYDFDPAQMVVAAGCGMLLNALAYSFSSDGDAWLVPTPYYPGFDNDLKTRAGVAVVPCPTTGPDFRLTAKQLRESYEAATARGTKISALLIANPSNPLGTCFQRDELEEVRRKGRSEEGGGRREGGRTGRHVVSSSVFVR